MNSSSQSTLSLLEEMSGLEGPISPPSNISTPGSSRSSTPFQDTGRKHSLKGDSSSAKRKCTDIITPFKLPCFSPDIKLCINKDTFYTSSQRNKLIKEGCLALRGHCWEEQRCVDSFEKKNLAIRLYELAPKSLGDHVSGSSGSKPEVSDLCGVV